MRNRTIRRRSFSRRNRAFSLARSVPEYGAAACVFERRGGPVFPRPPASRQARNIEAAMPSSRAIWLNGRPLLDSNPTASPLNSSVNCRRVVLIRHLSSSHRSLSKVSTISREGHGHVLDHAVAQRAHLGHLEISCLGAGCNTRSSQTGGQLRPRRSRRDSGFVQ